MENKNYPNYYIAGDYVSLSAQTKYINLVRADLLLMIISATLTVYNFQNEDSRNLVYVVSGLLLLTALAISIILKAKKYEDIWYRGRALAESCKTLTWRFIMCSEYFELNLNEQEVRRRFIERVKEIDNEFRDLNNVIKAKHLSAPIITSEMERIRQLSILDRKNFYLKNRIQNQIDWYSTKADSNKSKYENWFLVVITTQFLALISVAFLIKYPMSDFNLVGLFSTISACGFSWLQLKKYQENKEAYTTATSELNLIMTDANRIVQEEDFSKYVLDSENAMSREHTMWLAQKRR